MARQTEDLPSHAHLSRRERQIMDVLLARGEATAAEVRERLPDPPSYSAVRALLGKLVDKEHVTFRQEGPRYVYRPTIDRAVAGDNAWRRLIRTFFDGSAGSAMVSLLGREGDRLSDKDLQALEHELSRLKARRSSSAGEQRTGGSR